jgi:hypothetical protein
MSSSAASHTAALPAGVATQAVSAGSSCQRHNRRKLIVAIRRSGRGCCLTDASRDGSDAGVAEAQAELGLEKGHDLQHRERVDQPRVDEPVVVADAGQRCSGRRIASRKSTIAVRASVRSVSFMSAAPSSSAIPLLNATQLGAIPTTACSKF